MPFVPLVGRRPVAILALLLSGCVVALSLQVRRPGGQTVAEGWFLDLMGVGVRGVAGLREGAHAVQERTSGRRRLLSSNDALRSRVLELDRELSVLRDAERDRQRLLGLYSAHPSAPPESRVARMVSLVTAGPFHSALLDRGRAEGLETGGFVVGIHGLLGRVVGTGEQTARVQLLSDRLAAVGVLLPRSGRVAVARGNGTGGISVEYVPVIADVVAGDLVVTSGTDGIYPRDLPVGTIEAARKGGASLFLELPVRLTASPEQETTVFIFPPLAPREAGTDPTTLLPSSPRSSGRGSPARHAP
jgi:rod shape-determining protein MreC